MTYYFTVCHPEHCDAQTILTIEEDLNDKHIFVNGLAVSTQQLAELGILFFSLATKMDDMLDFYSISELLRGYDIPLPKDELKDVIWHDDEEYENVED